MIHAVKVYEGAVLALPLVLRVPFVVQLRSGALTLEGEPCEVAGVGAVYGSVRSSHLDIQVALLVGLGVLVMSGHVVALPDDDVVLCRRLGV